MTSTFSLSSSIQFFTEHLVHCNEVAEVTFVEDFVSTEGVILASIGDQLAHSVMEQLPIETDFQAFINKIAFAKQLTSVELIDDLNGLLEQDSALQAFSNRHKAIPDFTAIFGRLDSFSSVMLHLKVLKMQFPLVYQQALFCSWLGLLLMDKFKRSSEDTFYIVFLGLVHDIGLLYVPAEFVKSRKKFNYKQLRVLQLHTAAGFEVLKIISGLPEDVLRAVSEHHENLDGTGYPKSKVGSTICRLGQFLNFLDAINAIYTKRIKPGERSMRDLIPIIQMNGHSRFGVLGKKLIEWLKEMPEEKVRAVPNVLMPFLIQAVRDRNAYISSCVDIMETLSKEVGFRHGDHLVFALQNAIIHINISITQSGIINAAYMRWLDQVEAEGLVHAYREVEDVFLMMQEVIYHIGKLQNHIEYFLMSPRDSEEAYKLKKGLERLERIAMPKIHPNLEILWIANIH